MSKLVANLASTRKRIASEREETEQQMQQNQKKLRIDGGGKVAVAFKKGTKQAGGDKRSDVIYVGHLPPGFFEKEVRGFFGQFGDVQKFKLFRSKKTNGSKGYAFVKFGSVSVAETVSEAIDGYMVGERRLVSHVIPQDQLHGGMFLPPKKRAGAEGSGSRSGSFDGTISDTVSECFSDISSATSYDPVKAGEKRESRLQKKAAILRAAGIDFDVFLANAANSATPKGVKRGKSTTASSSSAAAPVELEPVAAAPKSAAKASKKAAAEVSTSTPAAVAPKSAAKSTKKAASAAEVSTPAPAAVVPKSAGKSSKKAASASAAEVSTPAADPKSAAKSTRKSAKK